MNLVDKQKKSMRKAGQTRASKQYQNFKSWMAVPVVVEGRREQLLGSAARMYLQETLSGHSEMAEVRAGVITFSTSKAKYGLCMLIICCVCVYLRSFAVYVCSRRSETCPQAVFSAHVRFWRSLRHGNGNCQSASVLLVDGACQTRTTWTQH